MLDFLEDRVLKPVVASNAPWELKRKAYFSRMCLRRLPALSVERYFWNSINESEGGAIFASQLEAAGFESFQTIQGAAAALFASLK